VLRELSHAGLIEVRAETMLRFSDQAPSVSLASPGRNGCAAALTSAVTHPRVRRC
jgi:hypothetical protein